MMFAKVITSAACLFKLIKVKSLMLIDPYYVLQTANEQDHDIKHIRAKSKEAYRWLHDRKVKGFYSVISSKEFRQGARALLQVCLKCN